MPSPLQIVKDKHGSKADLVDKVVGLIDPEDGESKDEHKRRLRNVANRKLLHLLDLGEKVKKAGGRDGLIKKVLDLKGQKKDHEYADSIKTMSLGSLADLAASVEHRKAGKAKKKPKKHRKKT